MSTLGKIRPTVDEPVRDLWPTLRARLATEDDLTLRIPPVTWPVIAAAATAVVVLVLSPEPVRLLAACGLI